MTDPMSAPVSAVGPETAPAAAECLPRRRLRACHECDLLLELPPLRPGERADCPRCSHVLVRRYAHPAQRSLALALSALLALLLAVSFPFVSFEARGVGNRMQVTETATSLINFNEPLVAILVILTIAILPACYLLAVIWLQIGLLRSDPLPRSRAIARALAYLVPWMMADVFVIGALVSLVKVAGMATIGLGLSFWAYCGFALLLLMTTRSLDRDWMWFALAGEPPAPAGARLGVEATPQGLVGCHICGLVNRLDGERQGQCRRCHEHLHARVPHSLQRTWALLLAAVVLYIPANMLPIMSTTSLGTETASTIVGGVMLFLQGGDIPIALIIFIASVVVPISKILALGWLCLKARGEGPPLSNIKRVRLYRLTELIGRWSMIDVFVVAVLVALIRTSAFMSISPGPAALAFAGVVILTMLAAITFDPRLLWDPAIRGRSQPKDLRHE